LSFICDLPEIFADRKKGTPGSELVYTSENLPLHTLKQTPAPITTFAPFADFRPFRPISCVFTPFFLYFFCITALCAPAAVTPDPFDTAVQIPQLRQGQGSDSFDTPCPVPRFETPLGGLEVVDFGARAANLENTRPLLAATAATVHAVFLSALQSCYNAQAARAALVAALKSENASRESLSAAEVRYTNSQSKRP
jgi:hypothetical protein